MCMYAGCIFLISLMEVHLSHLEKLPPELSVHLWSVKEVMVSVSGMCIVYNTILQYSHMSTYIKMRRIRRDELICSGKHLCCPTLGDITFRCY